MRRNGVGGLRGLRSEMDRLFDDFLGLMPARGENGSNVWAPAVDIKEDETSFYVIAELPGMKREDISVELENNVLSLKGERRFERSEEKENYHFVERSYGSFYRSFSLPRNVKPDEIRAEYKDGVLTLTLPKTEEVRPKKVEISG
jgi:HSP20 family protein